MVETKREKDGNREVLVVSGNLTVAAAGAIMEALLQLLDAGADMVVKVERIGSMDVTFLQLLCAAHRAAADRQRTLKIAGAEREPFASLLRSSGFLRHIGCRENTRRTCFWADLPAPRSERG